MFEFLFGKPEPEKTAEEKEEQFWNDISDFVGEIIILFNREIEDDFYRHIDVLRRKENQLLYRDEYGDLISDDFWRDYKEFLNNKIPNFKNKIFMYSLEHWDAYESSQDYPIISYQDPLFQTIYIQLRNKREEEITEIENDSSGISNFDDLTPEEYEKLISSYFTNLGWRARTTKGSGDQGADVIAEKYNVRLVIQCKLYSNPVGNKAVQEVVSALKYYEGHLGVVVTNSTFTKSARQLADSCNISLMNDDMLIPWLKNFERIREEE